MVMNASLNASFGYVRGINSASVFVPSHNIKIHQVLYNE